MGDRDTMPPVATEEVLTQIPTACTAALFREKWAALTAPLNDDDQEPPPLVERDQPWVQPARTWPSIWMPGPEERRFNALLTQAVMPRLDPVQREAEFGRLNVLLTEALKTPGEALRRFYALMMEEKKDA